MRRTAFTRAPLALRPLARARRSALRTSDLQVSALPLPRLRASALRSSPAAPFQTPVLSLCVLLQSSVSHPGPAALCHAVVCTPVRASVEGYSPCVGSLVLANLECPTVPFTVVWAFPVRLTCLWKTLRGADRSADLPWASLGLKSGTPFRVERGSKASLGLEPRSMASESLIETTRPQVLAASDSHWLMRNAPHVQTTAHLGPVLGTAGSPLSKCPAVRCLRVDCPRLCQQPLRLSQ